MTVSYREIAGQSRERLAAVSDGIFAVALTLLVLNFKSLALDSQHYLGAPLFK